MNRERRKFSRIPLQGIDCELKIEGLKFSGFLTQESIEGIAVADLDLIYLKYNQTATVNYSENTYEGRCRNIVRLSAGKFKVGIERLDVRERPEDEGRLLLAPFLRCEQHLVSCRPLGRTSDGRFVIRLFNGNEFATGRENIVTLTAGERLAQLDKETSELAARIYGVARREVMQLEFGILNSTVDQSFI